MQYTREITERTKHTGSVSGKSTDYFLGFVFSSALRRNSTLQVFSNGQMTSLKTIPVDRTRNYVAPKITQQEGVNMKL